MTFVSTDGSQLADELEDEPVCGFIVRLVSRPTSSCTNVVTMPEGSVDDSMLPAESYSVYETRMLSEPVGMVEERTRAVPPLVP